VSGTILLTGASGFLGMEILTRLLDRDEERIAVLIRAEDDDAARQRLTAVLDRLYDRPPPAAARVRVVRGDMQQPGLGLSNSDRLRLCDSVDRIIHCAASISFDQPLPRARDTNVEGVRRIIELAREIAETGHLRRLMHVSTAYVAGHHNGTFGETDLYYGQRFRNSYEQSKNEAERLLNEAGDLPTVIARPSMVVGHQACGWTAAFNVIYWPIRAYERGLLREIPARPDSIVDFVPVDYVASAVEALLDDDEATGAYNLVAGARSLSASGLLELLASLPRSGSGRPPDARLVEPRDGAALPPGAETLLSYFDVRCHFDDHRAGTVLERAGVERPDPRSYLPQLMSYARITAWGKRPISRQASLIAARPAVSAP